MKKRKLKFVFASLILASAIVYWVIAGVRTTSISHFQPVDLAANARETDGRGVQLDGFIAENSSNWDADRFELTFAVRDLENSVRINVISKGKLKPDNFKDGGNVFVEGRYDAEKNLITASKVQTKCASKYEESESTY